MAYFGNRRTTSELTVQTSAFLLTSQTSQVVNCHGLDHLNGARVEAVDDQNRSLLERPDAPQGARGARGSEITVQGPAVLLSKDPPRQGWKG